MYNATAYFIRRQTYASESYQGAQPQPFKNIVKTRTKRNKHFLHIGRTKKPYNTRFSHRRQHTMELAESPIRRMSQFSDYIQRLSITLCRLTICNGAETNAVHSSSILNVKVIKNA